ncbi:MAG: HAD family hydrolase [Spirochaetaceae bacterium]|nr:HAD family hydrolase [Spirochaetaceae bacterium]
MKVFRISGELKTIIFDIDSTLYTNEAYAREQVDVQVRYYAELRGIPADTARSQVQAYREKWAAEHNGAGISLGNTLAAFGIPIETSIRWREELLEPSRFLERDSRLAETFELLRNRFSLIAVTNNPVLPARKTLEALGADPFISEIIGLDTCGVSKPHRAPFLLAAEKSGVQAENCLAVGDRYDIDIALPLELGMGGILVDGVTDVYKLPSLLLP